MAMPQLTMPNVGEGVTEGTVTRWLKSEGDHVALDEPVVEVETDKAVVEIPSPYEGTLDKILVPEGGVVPIGEPLAEFNVATPSTPVPREDVEAEAMERPAVAATPTAETVDAAVAASKAPTSAAAAGAQPVAAVPRREAASLDADAATPTGAPSDGTASPPELRRRRQHSPVVMKLAAEHDLDLTLVRGTGIEGRVTRLDVMRYIENPAANTVAPSSHAGVVGVERAGTSGSSAAEPATPTAAPRPVEAPAPGASTGAEDQIVPLTPTRRTIAARMTESHQTIPVAWMAVEADVTGLVALRERVKDRFVQTEGVKLTYLPFFVQAIVGALKGHPQVNATFSDAGITLHARQHIGIAIATEWGLVVPVIRDAGEKSIAGLAREIDGFAAKARDRKLTVDEMRGATLTVDNTGAFGSVLSQPIVPVGQAAIITTEAIRRELRPLAGEAFGARSVMNLCISIDHRALDGAEAGAFMRDVTLRLEAYAPDQPVY